MNGWRVIQWVVWSVVMVASAVSTSAEDPPRAAPLTPQQTEFFEKKIRPVLVAHCYECHSEAAAKKGQLKGGLLVDHRAGLLQGGDSGPAVVVGDPDKSLLISALRYDAFEMPPKGKLADTVVADFVEWVKMGLPDPRRGEVAHKRPTVDIAAGRQHWAYQMPRPRPTPAITGSHWPLTQLDTFLLAAQESKRLEPGRDAAREASARRLSFDLVGMPMSPEDVDEFLADAAPDAWNRRVDRLLASPRFGERWGRHWLDVARYAESLTLRGFVLPEAWRYRDYVIETFNHDRPFDQFVLEQVGGDLLPATDLAARQRQRIATTFLVLGNTNLEEQDKKQLRMDVVDEQLETIGKGLLGQTLGCARCHDHKFDPIPTRDYYALAGILRSTKVLEHANVSKWLEFPLPVSDDQEQIFRRQETAIAALQQRIKSLKDAAKVAASGAAPAVLAGPQVVATKDLTGVVLDDSQAKKVGEWKASRAVERFIGDGYVHDLDTGKGEKTITFQPELAKAGMYEVRFAYTPGANRATNVPVTIFSADGEKTITVNEKDTPPIDARFISLGQYRFEANGQGFVLISNEGTNGHVIADAVQFLLPEARDTATPTKTATSTAPSPTPANTPVPANTTSQPNASATAPVASDEADLKKLEAELKQLTERGPKRPMVMSVQEEAADELGDTQVHIRGVVHNLGESVPRGFLQVASYGPPIAISSRESGRRELGQWLASPQNPLTARVFANRVWHWLLGAGIVRTTDNFGTTGEPPSHPELLDTLALRLIDSDWSTKSLVREIVSSHAYRLDTSGRPESVAADPENRWLSRANRRRLDAECLLDSILSVSGQLRFELGGSTLKPGTSADYGYQHDSTRRAVYWPALRNALPDLLEAFDFADTSMVTGRRTTSTVAPQALLLMNHPFVIAQSRLAARRLLSENHSDNRTRLVRIYRETLGREPTTKEAELALNYLAQAAPSSSEQQQRTWAQLIQVLFASIDFRYQ